MRRLAGQLCWAAAGAVLLAIAVPALGQYPIPTVSVTHPSNLTRLTVSNEQLEYVDTTSGDTTTRTYWITPGGRFVLYTGPNTPTGRGGNPTIVGDENKRIAGKDPTSDPTTWTSGFMVAVDPSGASPQFIDPFELAAAQAPNTDLTQLTSYWVQPFTVGSRDAQGTARVAIEQDANGNPSGYVTISVDYMLVGDALQVAIIVKNDGQQTHNFGLRIGVDGEFDKPGSLDGQPIFFPDGSVVTSESVIDKSITPITSANSTWVSYDPQNPTVAVRGYVGDNDTTELFNPGTATFAGGVPDRVEFGQERDCGVDQWNFVPNAAASLLHEDWAYGVKWLATSLAPGQSRRYVTWYGVGSSAPSYDPPFAMMAYVPKRLSAQENSSGGYDIVDDQGRSPFPVYLYLDNFGAAPLLNASARVLLPSGFELASGSPTVNLGIVPHDGLAYAQWNVNATASRPGQATFKFTGPQGRVLYASVDIPVLPVLNPLPSTYPDFEMVSFPYVFANKSADHVLSSLGSLSPGGPSTIVRYDPTEANAALRYKFYPDPFASTIQPGYGYWLLNLNGVAATMPTDRTAVPTTGAYNIPVYDGWNQIGNPFQYTVNLMDILVMDASGNTYTMTDAMNRHLLLPTLYSWDPQTHQYTWEPNPANVTMDPYKGYWLLAYSNLTLLVPPPVYQWTLQAKANPVAAAATGTSGWSLGLRAQTGSTTSEVVRLGAAPDAKDGWDSHDLPCPPEPAGLREARVETVLTGPDGTPCLADYLPEASARQEWTLQVQTNQVSCPVTITWPDIASLPPDLVPTLVDLDTGARRYMRTTSSYTFTSSAVGQARRFQVIVQPKSSVAPMVTAAEALPAGRGGASITYTLAAPAQVTVLVRNLAGRPVREVVANSAQEAGPNQVSWNGMNDAGSPVPSGRYLVQISAQSPDTGQSYQVVRTVQVAR